MTYALQSSSNQPGFFAVKVRSRGEGNVSKALRQKGFEVLLPTCALQALAKRMRKPDAALFPGYVFVRLDPRELLSLVTTEGVSYIVRNGRSLQPLPLEEELIVQTLCDGASGAEPWNKFVVGQQVTIGSGPLKGRSGTLVRVGERDRLILSLNSIFSSVSIDLRDTVVKPCD